MPEVSDRDAVAGGFDFNSNGEPGGDARQPPGGFVSDKGIIFSAPMVRALLEGRKTQTRRLLKPLAPLGEPVDLREQGDPGGNYSGRISDPASWGWPYAEDGACDMSLADWPEMSGYSRRDRLYVREACRAEEMGEDGQDGVTFLADDAFAPIPNKPSAGIQWLKLFNYAQPDGQSPRGLRGKSVPSIHMPRWASRLTLIVTDVRVQRVQEISEEDAQSEGLSRWNIGGEGTRWNWHDGPAVVWSTAREAFEALWNSLHTKPGETWADNPWIVAVTFDVAHGNIDRIAA